MEKNIIPIVSRIAVGLVFAVAILFFIWSYIKPTVQASGYYNRGYKNIENKNFNEVEEYFEKGFNIQPRFKEVVRFARGYRRTTRDTMKPKKIRICVADETFGGKWEFVFADFFRETKDFERLERKYKYMLKYLIKKIFPALLGLANTYMNWSEIENEKLNSARDTYFDVLDIDSKNKEAVFGNLNINLMLNNQKEIIKYYNFIEENFHTLEAFYILNTVLLSAITFSSIVSIIVSIETISLYNLTGLPLPWFFFSSRMSTQLFSRR